MALPPPRLTTTSEPAFAMARAIRFRSSRGAFGAAPSIVPSTRGVYRQLGRGEALELETPVDINRFSRKTQERVFDWLAERSARPR
jgi:hypothetical protein